jgi:MFS family permease
LVPLSIALLSDRSYDSERGKVYSVCLGGFDVGIAIAGPILGAIAQSRGYREMFFLCASLALLSLLLFITQSNKSLSNSFRFAFGKTQDLYALEESH